MYSHMPKKVKSKQNKNGFRNGTYYPLVSVCTPTYNRRPFIKTMFACFKNQTYPKDRIEWIIVDDGTDKVRDLINESGIQQIKYYEVEEKMSLGAKRNYMHKFVKGTIIVYMDDDDYYPPERIEHAVERLQSKPEALCAGSSEIYVYFKGMDKMMQCGPYNENHATAGTFAFRKKLLDETKYEDEAALAEEKKFLKEYTIPFVQLDPVKTILVFSHEHNTFDKRKLFDNPNPQVFKESDKSVTTFIRQTKEADIKKFFLEDIDKLLDDYDPGKPAMKPDVLKQIKVIEANRAKMIEEAKQSAPITIQQADGTTKQLNNVEVVEIIKKQQQQLQELSAGQTITIEQPGQPPQKLAMPQIVELLRNQQEQLKSMSAQLNNANSKIGELTKEISDMKATQPSEQPSEQPQDNSVIEVSGNETNI